MPTLLQLKSKIKTTSAVVKITKTMQLISAAKMKKSRSLLVMSGGFLSHSARCLVDFFYAKDVLLSDVFVDRYKFLQDKDGSIVPTYSEDFQPLIVCIGSSKGLCGSLNSGLFKLVDEFASARKVECFAIGTKMKHLLDLHSVENKNLKLYGLDLDFAKHYEDIDEIVQCSMKELYKGRSVYLAYNKFCSMGVQQPILINILDRIAEFSVDHGRSSTVEGDVIDSFSRLVELYIGSAIWDALVHNIASEHAMRWKMMESATKNGTKMIDILRLKYNKTRQQNITKDILDIIGGTSVINESQC